LKSVALEYSPQFGSDQPVSEFLNTQEGINREFCYEWNPEFLTSGQSCCTPKGSYKKGLRPSCAPHRRLKWDYCDEMTASQAAYIEKVQTGKIPNVLEFLDRQLRLKRPQSYCSVNDGFLAWGRPLVPTEKNRIRFSNPKRCVNFGSDELVAMLEWLGQKVGDKFSSPEYSETHLLLGDLSAPRGGCISGRGGRRGHSSHTSGLDVDIGFLTVISKGGRAPAHFHRTFDANANWWLLKQMFQNPYACVQQVFLDRKHIDKLRKIAKNEPQWQTISKHLKHVKGHRDHFHIRIASGSKLTAACPTTLDEDYETEEGVD
jgi:murein endopeptidase